MKLSWVCAPSFSFFVRSMNEFEGIWMSSCGPCLMTNIRKPTVNIDATCSGSFCSLCSLKKKHQEEIYSWGKGKEKKTWLCCCRRGLNLLKISVAALCFFFLSYKWRCPENSSIRQNDFTCCPRDRECWLGSHVSFFSCCLLSLSPKQWLWETVGALMCLCWGHQWCHQLHCHVYMTHWVPDTHRRLLSCFHVC